MAQAGFDPRAATALWDKMEKQGSGKTPAFLSTHPAPDKRSQVLGQKAQQLMPVYQQARANGHTPNCKL
jgi:predicted Zn-dependent protease